MSKHCPTHGDRSEQLANSIADHLLCEVCSHLLVQSFPDDERIHRDADGSLRTNDVDLGLAREDGFPYEVVVGSTLFVLDEITDHQARYGGPGSLRLLVARSGRRSLRGRKAKAAGGTP